MAWHMGIDIGSRTSKGVLMLDGEISAQTVIATGPNHRLAAERVRDELLERAGLTSGDIERIVATGNSRAVPFSDEQVSDLVCCARGVNHIFPLARTVIDVQAQSSRVLRLAETGRITDFVVTEKCAAGSGFFMDIIANVLRIDIEEVGPLSLKSQHPAVFSTACAVFGESEAISRVAEGATKEDILAGVHNSVADKIFGLVGRVGIGPPCAMTGGGALDAGLIRSLESRLSVSLLIPQEPRLITAIGAAIMARGRPEHSPLETPVPPTG